MNDNSYHVDFTISTIIDFNDEEVMDFFHITKREVNETYREKYLNIKIDKYAEEECLNGYNDCNYYKIAKTIKRNNTKFKVVK